MRDLAFYNTHEPQGIKKLVMIPRRLLRRLLRPIFQKQVALFQWIVNRLDVQERAQVDIRDRLEWATADLKARQDDLAEQLQTTLAFGWDYVALVRRLAVLEDQLATVTGAAPAHPDEAEAHASILFPGLEKLTPPAHAVRADAATAR